MVNLVGTQPHIIPNLCVALQLGFVLSGFQCLIRAGTFLCRLQVHKGAKLLDVLGAARFDDTLDQEEALLEAEVKGRRWYQRQVAILSTTCAAASHGSYMRMHWAFLLPLITRIGSRVAFWWNVGMDSSTLCHDP